MTRLEITDIETPIGALRLAAREGALCAAIFVDHWEPQATRLAARFGAVSYEARPASAAAERFTAYFAGDLRALDELPVDLGGTPFQARVWAELRRIPAGATSSYGELAARVGAGPGASRAVGSANAANPVCVAIPCHRVIAATGAVSGYAGGVPRKRWLLDHEAPGAAALYRPVPAS